MGAEPPPVDTARANEAAEVWIASSPTPDARRALDAWAGKRGLKLTIPRDLPLAETAVDLAHADTIEQEIERAREAVATQDVETAERALRHAEEVALAHPELPNAAWLLAEVERGWSARWARVAPIDAEKAAGAWRRADALDGGRVAGIGEVRAAPNAARITLTFALDRARRGEVKLWLDGEEVAGTSMQRPAGRHVAVATRESDGAVAWASWLTATADTTTEVRLPEPAPCSREDVRRAHLRGAAVQATGVSCGRWVAVLANDSSALRIASCFRDRCGPLEDAAPQPTKTRPGGGPVVHGGFHWPAWATWTLAIAGGVAIVTTVVVASGVLEPAPRETRFVNGGVDVRALGFSF